MFSVRTLIVTTRRSGKGTAGATAGRARGPGARNVAVRDTLRAKSPILTPTGKPRRLRTRTVNATEKERDTGRTANPAGLFPAGVLAMPSSIRDGRSRNTSAVLRIPSTAGIQAWLIMSYGVRFALSIATLEIILTRNPRARTITKRLNTYNNRRTKTTITTATPSIPTGRQKTRFTSF